MAQYQNWGAAYWDAANKGYDLQQKITQNAELTDRERAIADILANYKAQMDAANQLQEQANYQTAVDPSAPTAPTVTPPSAIPYAATGQYSVPTQGYAQQMLKGNAQMPMQAQQAINGGVAPAQGAGQTPNANNFATRTAMANKAIEDRAAAIQQAYAKTRASNQAGAFIRDLNATEQSQFDAKDNRFIEQVKEAFAGDDWLDIPGIEGIIQSAANTLQSYTPIKMGQFQVKKGKNGNTILLNNTGKGWHTIPNSAINKIKRMAMAEVIGLRTNKWDSVKDYMEGLNTENTMWNRNRQTEETARHNRATEGISRASLGMQQQNNAWRQKMDTYKMGIDLANAIGGKFGAPSGATLSEKDGTVMLGNQLFGTFDDDGYFLYPGVDSAEEQKELLNKLTDKKSIFSPYMTTSYVNGKEVPEFVVNGQVIADPVGYMNEIEPVLKMLQENEYAPIGSSLFSLSNYNGKH